jgi:hypothetical protein
VSFTISFEIEENACYFTPSFSSRKQTRAFNGTTEQTFATQINKEVGTKKKSW